MYLEFSVYCYSEFHTESEITNTRQVFHQPSDLIPAYVKVWVVDTAQMPFLRIWSLMTKESWWAAMVESLLPGKGTGLRTDCREGRAESLEALIPSVLMSVTMWAQCWGGCWRRHPGETNSRIWSSRGRC